VLALPFGALTEVVEEHAERLNGRTGIQRVELPQDEQDVLDGSQGEVMAKAVRATTWPFSLS
jgi:hypothetical protein